MNLKLFGILATGLFFMFLSVAVAQQNITISGSGLGDVMIYRNLRPGYEYTVNTNYAAHSRIAAVAWTASG